MEQGELRVFTHDRRPIGTIYPVRNVSASWALGGQGALSFTIPKNSIRWSDSYVRHRYKVEYHDERIDYPWIGFIQDHAPADADVTITCLAAEALYADRHTERYVVGLGKEAAGQIVHLLHEQAVRDEPLGVLLGEIDLSGPNYYVKYALKQISQGLDELAELTGGHWWVEKRRRVTIGGLSYYVPGREHVDPWLLRWARTIGVDRTNDVTLAAEVTNLPDYHVTSAGMATAAHVLGVDIGGEERLYVYVPDKAARRVYGLITTVLDFPEIMDPTLLEEAGKRELYRRNRPLKTLGITVDDRRSMWGLFWLGDLIRVTLTNVGYLGLDAIVRVMGIQLDAASGQMGLVVELQ